jgi:chromosome segregation ATPase
LDEQSLDLKATQDDLAKAKATLDSTRLEVESVRTQLDEARAAVDAAAAASPEHLAEVERLTTELSHAKDDLAAVSDMLNLTKASLGEMSNNHSTELEEAAKGRAEEVTKLRTAHEEEVTALVKQKSDLLMQVSDLQGELTILKASISAEPPSPKGNGNGAAHIPSPSVTREELQQMHEAHNLKVHDLQAEHDKAIKALQEQLETALSQGEGLQQDVARKAMEIQYLEQEQDEHQDQITRYVRFFGLKSLIGGIIALGVIIGLV